MTANTVEKDREACLAAGMDGHLSKPICAEELLATLRGVCWENCPERLALMA
jgi:CheY-like chemotaxis protein